MGSIVEFPSNGSTARGYYAPAEGGGPGVVVIQEWWGLVPHIEEVCDRFAAAGFSALAPYLYHGETTTEPDEAGKLMMALNIGQAVKDMAGAIAFLQADESVTSEKVGVIGFCMGGGLALVLAASRPDAIGACAPFYGLIPWEGATPDWSSVTAPVRGHFAELDGFFGPDLARGLEETMRNAGVDAQITIHPGVEHAFFNDHRPEVYNAEASSAAWDSTLAFLSDALG
ncbi:MAG: dienelactone hydrolase family protein [Microthrixaceae bacterium]|nr:dienelactone hydrolase family protein [Microthrixaceae bacterium]